MNGLSRAGARRFELLGTAVALVSTAACGARSVRTDVAEGDGGTASDASPQRPDASVVLDDASVVYDAGPDPCETPDADGDGHVNIYCGGDDCDDSSPDMHPGARDPVDWEIETIDEKGVGHVAATIDSDDSLIVLYARGWPNALVQARGIWGDWASVVVDPEGSGFPAVVVDGEGTVHVAYVRGRDGNPDAAEVVYSNDTEGFVLDAIDDIGDWSAQVGVAAGPEGTVYVGYSTEPVDRWKSGGELRVGRRVGASWEIQTVDAGDRLISVSTGVDPVGELHLVYANREPDWDLEIRHAVTDWREWRIEDLGAPVVVNENPTSLCFDSGGAVRILYGGTFLEEGDDRWLAETAQLGLTDERSAGPLLALDSTDRAHGLGMQAGFDFSDCIRHGERVPGGWHLEALPDGCQLRESAAIVIDSQDRIHVVFHGVGIQHAVRLGLGDEDCDGEDA